MEGKDDETKTYPNAETRVQIDKCIASETHLDNETTRKGKTNGGTKLVATGARVPTPKTETGEEANQTTSLHHLPRK